MKVGALIVRKRVVEIQRRSHFGSSGLHTRHLCCVKEKKKKKKRKETGRKPDENMLGFSFVLSTLMSLSFLRGTSRITSL